MSIATPPAPSSAPETSESTESALITPYVLQSGSSLIDDVVGWNDIIIDGANWQSPQIAPYRVGDEWQAAVIVDGVCNTLSRSDGAAAWQLTPGPATGCLGVVVARTPDNAVWTMVVKQNGVSVFSQSQNATGFPSHVFDISGRYTGVGVAYTPALPVRLPVLYMADEHGNLITYTWVAADTPWQRRTFNVKGSLKGKHTYTFRLVALSPVHYNVGLTGEYLTWWSIDLTKGSHAVEGPHYVKQAPSPKYLVGGYQLDWQSARFIYTRSGENALYVQGSNAVTRIPGIGQTAQATVDDQGMLHVYVIPAGTDSPLSVLHQTGWDAEGPTWYSVGGTPTALPLASSVYGVVTDPLPQSTPGVVVLGPPMTEPEEGRALRLLTKDPVTDEWREEPFRTAMPTYHHMPRWQIRASLFDAGGRVLPDHAVRVRSLSTSIVHVKDRSHRIGPRDDEAVTLRTDASGAVTFAMVATSLTPPSVLFEADGLAQEAELRPAKSVHDWFAGMGDLPGKGPFDGSTLADAKVDGTKLVPTWSHGMTADHAAQTMKWAMALADPNLPQPPKTAYLLQRFDASRPGYQEFDTREDLEAELAWWREAPHYGGFFDDVADFFEDLASGIASGAAQVGSVLLDAGNKAVRISLKIAGKLVPLVEFAIHTVRDAVQAVEALWNLLEAGIDRVIDWLKALFNTRDLWDTKTALEAGICGFPDFLRQRLDDASQYTGGFFARQKDTVHRKIAAAKDLFGTKSFDDQPGFADGVAGYLGRPSGTPGSGDIVGELRSPTQTWMLDQVMATMSNPQVARVACESVLSPTQLTALGDAWDRFNTALESSGDAFRAALDDAGRLFSNLLQATSLESLARVEIVTLLDLADHLVEALLDLCDALVQALIALLESTVSSIETLLTSPLNIGLLQDLVDFLARQAGQPSKPLTFVGLISFVAAFPVTLTWKAIHGSDAQLFPGGRLPTAVADASSGSDEYLKNRECAFVGAVLSMADGVYQAVLDAFPTEAPHTGNRVAQRLNVTAITGLRLAAAVFNWPTERGIPFTDWESVSTSTGRWPAAAWFAGVCAPLVDAAPYFLGSGKLARYSEKTGQWALCVIGACSATFALVGALEGTEPWPWKVSAISEPITDALQPIRPAVSVTPDDGLRLAAKALADIVGITVPGFMRYVYNTVT